MEAMDEASRSPEDVRAWAEAHGVSAVLGLKVTMVSGLVNEELLRAAGCGWSNAPSVALGLESPVAALRTRCRRFLNEQAARRRAAERDDAAWVRALAEPEHPVLAGLERSLLELRARLVAAIGPRASEVPRARFAVDADAPGFSVRAWVCDPLYEARGDGLVWLDAARWQTEALAAKCGCAFGRNGAACIHALCAVDEAIVWTGAPETPERDAHVIALLAEPPWQRLLQALDRSLAGETVAAKSEVLAWRLSRRLGGLGLEPCIKKITRGGALSAGSRIDPARVPELGGVEQLPADLRAALALVRDDFFSAMQALCDHPRVSLDGLPVAVVSGALGVAVLERSLGLSLVPTIDGVPLADNGALADALAAELGGVVVPDADGGCVRVVAASGPVREVVRAALAHPHPIPRAHAQKLVERLPALERCTSVRLPESLRGEEVMADARLVLRLRAADIGARVEAWVNPLALPHAPMFRPGDGPLEVASEREGTRIFARRDRAAERAHAERIIARLPLGLPEAPESPWSFALASDEAVLDLLAAVNALDEPVEAEWRHDSERRLQLVGEARPEALSARVKKGRDWFELEGTVSLDGDRIKLADVLEAMRRGHRYVRLDLQRWLRIERSLQERLEKLSHAVHASRGKLELSLHAAPAMRDLASIAADVEADAAWQAVMRKLSTAEQIEPEVPAAFAAELRPYQREGFAWMCRLCAFGTGGILADDMGLGKTVQALALLALRQRLGPQLVIAPTSVCFNWRRECERFAPTLRVRDWSEAGETLEPGDLVIVSYGVATRDRERLSAHAFATLIVDEAQAVKNPATARAQAVRAIQAEVRFGLSGTPIENHLGELWSLMRIVAPGLLGSWDQFRKNFLSPIEKDDHARRRQMLAELVRPFILRRTKAEVLPELPGRTEIRIDVTPSAEERELYETARLEAITSLARTSINVRTDARFQVLAAITRLRLLACHPKLYDPASTLTGSKLEAFLRLVDELRENRHRALVFSQFTRQLALVREALDARGVAHHYLDGATPPAERARAVDAFQAGERELFLVSLKAGGMGLNLTAADYVVHLDPWWNPAVEEQATGRAHRLGQTRPVTVYRLVTSGTIEEQILALHRDKRDMIAGVLDDNDAAARLSLDELRALLERNPCTLIFSPSPKT